MRRSVLPSSRLVLSLGLLCVPVLGCSADSDSNPTPANPTLKPDAEGAPLAAVVPHWNALIARSGGEPAVRWSDRGTPMSLLGTLSTPMGSVSADAARSFLAASAQLLQLTGDLAGLEEDASVESPLGTHVTFVQR